MNVFSIVGITRSIKFIELIVFLFEYVVECIWKINEKVAFLGTTVVCAVVSIQINNQYFR